MLLLSFLTLTTNAETLDKNLYYEYRWETYPTIEICPDSEVTTKLVNEVLDYWEDRGVEVKISSVKKVNYCNPDKNNVIQLMATGIEIHPYEIAVTINNWYRSKGDSTYWLSSSHVLIPNEVSDASVIVKHEIGHALGLAHSSSDNVMRPIHKGY